MASKGKAPVAKRLSSFSNSQALQSKNQDLVAKATLHGKNTSKVSKRATPTFGKSSNTAKGKISGKGKQNTYSKEAEEKFDSILDGDFTDVPPLPRSTVRIFLSSTFADMRAERNALAREAYPNLRDYCAEQGLSFQVVDLRWGLTAEATNSHVTTKICLLELENCQKISLGPSCIALLGNRYGFCPLPYEIPPDEYGLLSKEATSLGLDGAALLDSWYLKDDNAVPPVFCLQPITGRLPNFLNEKPGEEKKREADVKAWGQIEHQLIEAIHEAALSCAAKNTLSVERAHFYVMSVTEHEARNGILPGKHALAFLRELSGLDGPHLSDVLAGRHKETVTIDGQIKVNKEIEKRLTSLKSDLSEIINAVFVKSYDVPWEAGGLNPESVESHKQYISQFCHDFISSVKQLIDQDIQASSSLIRQREYYSPYAETLHHAHFCKMKCQSFCGQKETLEKIKSYILDLSNRKPYVIHAHSGAGKTSIMAKAMASLGSWISDKYTSIIRFLGTSPNSTNIYSVLYSVCGQLADVTDSIMEPQGYKTMKSLHHYLPRFLRTISSSLKMPVIIFLDSVDQLEPYNDAYSMKWLPQTLPNNVKIIISTLPKEHGILKNLQTVLSDPGNFFEVPILSDDTSHEIVERYFAVKKRCITEEQMKLLLETFRKAASPLYLKLLMDQAIAWKSWEGTSFQLPVSVKSAINLMFEQLEVKFGVKIVQAALGLITVGFNGLSEIELEDAISCVDEALIEIYKYHDPPVPGMVRVPPVLWARIRYDISEYLVERQSQGVATLFWYHRQFIEAAHERYAQGDKGQHLHKILFEMYASEKGIKKDIILTQRRNLEIKNADRYTTPQPTSSKNLRKLECMSYHLKCGFNKIDRNIAISASYCNMNFLQAKVASSGSDKLIAELQEFLKISKSREIKILHKFVTICKNSLSDTSLLAFKILAYINTSTEDVNLNNLKVQAKDYLMSQPKTTLIPSYACLAKRQGEPEQVFDNLSCLFTQCNETCLLSENWTEEVEDLENTKTLACLDLKTLEIKKFACENINSRPCLSSDGKMIFYLSEAEMMLVKVSLSNGMITKAPLPEVFSSAIKMLSSHISRGHCCIAGSYDSKLLATSIHDRVSVIGVGDFKNIFHLTTKDVHDISNLHICDNSTLVVVGKDHKDGILQSENIIQIWTNSQDVKQRLSLKIDVTIRNDDSAVTYDENYHVCFGKNEDGSKNLITLCNLKSFLVEEQIDVNEEIHSMKMCPSDAQCFFLIGHKKLKLLDFSHAKFTNALNHDKNITTWTVNWEEEYLLICDEQGNLILFNFEMERLMTRNWALSTITTIANFQDNILLLTNNKAKIWNMQEFFLDEKSDGGDGDNNGNDGEHLKMDQEVLSFLIADNSKEIITVGSQKECKVWSSDSNTLLHKFDIGIKASKILLASSNKVVAFDKEAKKVIVFDFQQQKIICNDLPENIMCITMTKDKCKLLLVTYGSKPVIYTYNLKSNSSSKNCSININFKCLDGEVSLTPSERYAVFLMKNTDADFQAISKMWKSGDFPHQNHPYRFVGVDLSQGSGSALYAYFSLSKIPHLGVTMEPYRGNQMMLSTRRWVMFWDLPTGKCGQTLSKATRKTSMYRPDWLGQDCVGDNDVICMADSKQYVAVGSQDGYVFVYEAESGMPVGMQAPTAKHPSPVNLIAFTRSGQLVASVCTSGLLKLWSPHSGECIFSASLGIELQQLNFTKDESKLVALTRAEKSHMVIFDITNLPS